MSTFCKCGEEIHPKRVEFLTKYNKALICINCAEGTVKKVGGFMSVEGKTDRQIIIADMDTIENLHKVSQRAGTGVSKGVKMNQTYSVKYIK